MPQSRSQNRDLAFSLWTESDGKRSLTDIANELQVSPELIRKWKSQDKWEHSAVPNRTRGGQKGNRNAAGNTGGAPSKNANAVRTGEFESILFDALLPNEQTLINRINLEKVSILKEELILLTIRERRMLQRISDASSIQDTEAIHRIEEALTRVQTRKQVAVDQLHKIDVDALRHNLDLKRLEIDLIKAENSNTQTSETADDNFLMALEKRAGDIWTDDFND